MHAPPLAAAAAPAAAPGGGGMGKPPPHHHHQQQPQRQHSAYQTPTSTPQRTSSSHLLQRPTPSSSSSSLSMTQKRRNGGTTAAATTGMSSTSRFKRPPRIVGSSTTSSSSSSSTVADTTTTTTTSTMMTTPHSSPVVTRRIATTTAASPRGTTTTATPRRRFATPPASPLRGVASNGASSGVGVAVVGEMAQQQQQQQQSATPTIRNTKPTTTTAAAAAVMTPQQQEPSSIAPVDAAAAAADVTATTTSLLPPPLELPDLSVSSSTGATTATMNDAARPAAAAAAAAAASEETTTTTPEVVLRVVEAANGKTTTKQEQTQPTFPAAVSATAAAAAAAAAAPEETSKQQQQQPPPSDVEVEDEFDGAGAAAAAAATAWQTLVDPASRQEYYYNAATGETSWERPFAAQQQDDSFHAPAAAAAAAAAEALEQEAKTTTTTTTTQEEETATTTLPIGWVTVLDPSSGVPYYYNQSTGETSWELPSAIQTSSHTPNEEAETKKESPSPTAAAAAEPALEPMPIASMKAGAAVDDQIEGEEPIKSSGGGDSAMQAEEEEEEDQINAAAIAETQQPQVDEITPVSSSDEVTQQLLPEGWEKLLDPASGDYYFYNELTGETSWEAPTSAAAMTPALPEQKDQLLEEEQVSPAISRQQEEEEEEPVVVVDDDKVAPAISEGAEEESAGAEVPLPAGWTKIVDSSFGQTYYYNETTGATSWDPPVEDEMATEEESPVKEEEPVSESPVAEIDEVPQGTMDGEENGEEVGQRQKPKDARDSEPVLPSGWERLVDPSSGDEYYYNEVTEESSWDPPPVLAEQPAEAPTTTELEQELATDSGAKVSLDEVFVVGAAKEDFAIGAMKDTNGEEESTLPPGWEKLHDPTSGVAYYYNDKTGETSWEPPSSIDARPTRTLDETLPVEQSDAPENAPEEPEKEESGQETYETFERPERAGETSILPTGWEKVVDSSSGDVCYYNEITGDTSLEFPAVEHRPTMEESPSVGEPSEAEPLVTDETVKLPTHGHEKDDTNIGQEQLLPLGWEKLVDPASGDAYYYNEGTGESSWEPPALPEPIGPEVPAEGTEPVPGHLAEEADGSIGGLENELSPVEQPIDEPIHDRPADEAAGGDQHLSQLADSGQEDVEPTLPPGWEKLMDPSSGDVYYYKEETGESSWHAPVLPQSPTESTAQAEIKDQPVEQPVEESDHDHLADKAGFGEEGAFNDTAEHNEAGQTLPLGWEKLVDPSSGDAYYYNEATGESSWELPESDISAKDKKLHVEPSADEAAGGDQHAPEAAGGDQHAPEAVARYHNDAEPTLQPGWEKLVDPSSGETYYYNEASGESSWEPPLLPMPMESEAPAEKEGPALVQPVDEPIHDQPADEAAGGDQQLSEVAKDGQEEVEPTLPPGWEKLVDPSSGDAYYYNEETGESSWEAPVIPQPQPTESTILDENTERPVEQPLEEPISDQPADKAGGGKEGALNDTAEHNEAGPTLPPGWDKLVDPSSGDTYYYNEETGESSWDTPLRVDAEPAEITSPEEPQVASGDDTTPVPEQLESESGERGASTDLGTARVDENDSELPQGWEKLIDPDSGEAFYFNEATGETSWESPATATTDQDQSKSQPVQQLDRTQLPPDWTMVTDPASGDKYYYNEETGETSWEAPVLPAQVDSAVEIQAEAKGTKCFKTEKKSIGRPAHALAVFGFRGRLCIVRPRSGRKAAVAVHSTCHVAPASPIAVVENAKQNAGFCGPLNVDDSTNVLAYIDAMRYKNQDLLWNLVSIAARSRGRLRCDHVGDSSQVPESLIVNLLLDEVHREGTNGVGSPSRSSHEMVRKSGKYHTKRLSYNIFAFAGSEL